MKHMSFVYGIVGLALAAAGCASSSAPAVDASSAGRSCVALGPNVVTTDTVVRASNSSGAQPNVVNVDPLYLQGRGVSSERASVVPTRTVARTEFSRGGAVTCD
jgi:hypothetical protein